MNDNSIYTPILIDHYKNPHNFGNLENKTHIGEMRNRSCGDELTFQLKINKNRIVEEAKFSGQGCALTIATASLLSEQLRGMSVDDIEKLNLESANALLQINISPSRITCVMLPIQAAQKATQTPIKSI